MITMQEWKAMSSNEQTAWLMKNKPANKLSLSMRNLVEGVGVNDAPYCAKPTIDGKLIMCPSYRAWANMLKRSHSIKLHAKYPTYSGVKMCEEWRSFMNFRAWWISNQVDGFELDKDLLSDSAAYCPDACIFVPQWLNTFTTDHGSARGEWPIGVFYQKDAGRFRARCSNPVSKKFEHLGLFDTPEEAHLAWLKRKLELAIELKPRMDSIDRRIYPRVVEIINNAK